MFSMTPATRRPVFCAIVGGARGDLLRERLRRRHDHRLGARQELAERDRDVAGTRGHVDDEHVELAPVHVLQELLERTVQHRTAPHDGLRCLRGRSRSTSVSDRARPAARSSCRRRRASGRSRACAGSSGRRCRRRGSRPRRPRAASAAAMLTVTVDLPTPPFPEATASTRVVGRQLDTANLRTAAEPGRERGTLIGRHDVELECHRVDARERRHVLAVPGPGSSSGAGSRPPSARS